MKILMLGDVNGGPGRRMLTEHVKRLKAEFCLGRQVANVVIALPSIVPLPVIATFST